MNKRDLQRYREKLLGMRTRSRNEINRIVQVVLDDAEAPGEHDHNVSESVDKEVALERTEESIRMAVLDALQRIEQGIYGACVQCGTAIPRARLDAIPYTAHCVDCERGREK
jgi:DnaK suppressor protein